MPPGVRESRTLRAGAIAAALKASETAAEPAEEEAIGDARTVTRKDLIEKLSTELSVPRSQIEKVLNLFASHITQELANGKKVYISKLGTFGLRRRGPRPARNPKTGEVLEAPAATFPSFSFSRNIREAVRDTLPLFDDGEGTSDQQEEVTPKQDKKEPKLFGWLP